MRNYIILGFVIILNMAWANVLGNIDARAGEGLPARCHPYKGSYFDIHHQLSFEQFKNYCNRAPFVAECASGRFDYGERSSQICRRPDRIKFWITVPDA
jgi:hypothetical protein